MTPCEAYQIFKKLYEPKCPAFEIWFNIAVDIACVILGTSWAFSEWALLGILIVGWSLAALTFWTTLAIGRRQFNKRNP